MNNKDHIVGQLTSILWASKEIWSGFYLFFMINQDGPKHSAFEF